MRNSDKLPSVVFPFQKFLVGDILSVREYDQGEGEWREGITEVIGATNYEGSPHISRGMYSLSRISGNFTAVSYNADFFEDEQRISVKLLGNIYLNKKLRKTVEVLYDKSNAKRNRTSK